MSLDAIRTKYGHYPMEMGESQFQNQFTCATNLIFSLAEQTGSVNDLRCINGWQLAKMKKSIPDMSLS